MRTPNAWQWAILAVLALTPTGAVAILIVNAVLAYAVVMA